MADTLGAPAATSEGKTPALPESAVRAVRRAAAPGVRLPFDIRAGAPSLARLPRFPTHRA